jgi:hypothetical protein
MKRYEVSFKMPDEAGRWTYRGIMARTAEAAIKVVSACIVGNRTVAEFGGHDFTAVECNA